MRRLALAALVVVLGGCGILIAAVEDDPAPSPPADAQVEAEVDAGIDGALPDTGTDAAVDAGLDAATGHRDLVVFATFATFDGAFNGLAGGDALCKSEANAAGLTDAVAWLSTATVNASARLPDGDISWHLADPSKTVVFASKSDLLLAHPPAVGIARGAGGLVLDVITAPWAWTGTKATGNVSSKGQCVGGGLPWTSNLSTTAGAPGKLGATTAAWTNDPSVNLACNQTAHLICFQR